MDNAGFSERYAVPVFDIVARHKRSRLGVASAADFQLEYSGTLSSDVIRKSGIVYCADFQNSQVLYTLFRDPPAVLQHPFLYSSQYDHADRIACVHFRNLEAFHSKTLSRPNFVFSAGRCGSTLLAALLRACGLPTASEPDLMTQLARERVFETNLPLAGNLQQVCMTSLAAHYGIDLAVKLRSQCNSIALHIAREFPAAKIVFILREPIGWARSRYRAFPGDPKALAHLYRAAVNSYARLCEIKRRPVLVWYEDIASSPTQVLELLALEGLPVRQIRAEWVTDVMCSDSQAETHLDSRKLKGPEMTVQQIQEFDIEWQRIRPAMIIEQYGLQGRC